MKNFLKQKRQTAVRGRSSALLITIIVHVVLFLVAGTYVAMEVIERQEAKFEAKQIARPKMKIKKLQVPVKIEQNIRQQAPKLSHRMTASTRVKTKSVDFQMPEMAGFGRGSGVSVASGGFGGSLGFATTQLNVFGLKSTGEKIVFLLDTSPNMLIDEIGGIPAYTLIKEELLTLIGSLPPTALFNVVIFDWYEAKAFSKKLSPASDANIEKIKAWLGPLNRSKEKTGFKTLPNPGTQLAFEPAFPIMNAQYGWICGLSYAIQKGADSVYWLGTRDLLTELHKDLYAEVKRGKPLKYFSGWAPGTTGWDYDAYPGGKEKWDELIGEARKKFEAENKQRQEAGKPLRVIQGWGLDFELVEMYYPGKQKLMKKEDGKQYVYMGLDLIDYIETMQKKYAASDRRSASIGLKKKAMSLNVIHFVPKTETETVKISTLDRLRPVAQKFNGDYLQVKGLDAIKSSATGSR